MRSSLQRWLVVLISGVTSLGSMLLSPMLMSASAGQDETPTPTKTEPVTEKTSTPAPKATETKTTSPSPKETKSSSPKPTKSEAAPSAVAGAMKDGTFTGGKFSAGSFGTVKVTITVSGGKITKVSTPSLPSRDRESQRINQQAGPYLRDQAIGVKSAADIAGVTGASYTTSAFKKSLQDAINKSKK